MELKQIFKLRRSHRKFTKEQINDDIIEDILFAANSAPCTDSCNYYFGVIKDEEIKKAIGKATIFASWVSKAPVIFICCSNISYDIKDDDPNGYVVKGMTARYGKEIVNFLLNAKGRKRIKTIMQSTPVYIAAQHMILSAVSHGLRSCLVDFIKLEKINKILNLPENISCELIVPIGYPNDNPTPINTNDKNNVFYDRWE